MPDAAFRFLRPEDIRRLGGFEFAPKLLVEGYLAGRHRSRGRGSSIEFRDYRPYVPGDDPSLIDWRVLARTDRRYLKTFEQETNMECHVFLDSSASMGFGASPTKLEYASFFTAALCYLVVRNNDRVSLQIFDETIRTFLPPGSTHRHLQNAMRVLEDNRPGGTTSIAAALRRSFPLLKRRGTLIVVSDFLDEPAAIFAALSPYLHRGFKIHIFQILSPHELDLDDRGLVTFVDLETGRRVIAHTESVRRAYTGALHAHVAALRELAIRRGVEHVVARTDQHYFRLFENLTR